MSTQKRKKKNGSLNKWFIIGIAAFLFFIIPSAFFFKKDYTKNNSKVLSIAESWQNSVEWSATQDTTEVTPMRNLTGKKVTGKMDSKHTIIPFPSEETLGNMGFEIDNSLAADGPGSSIRGYKNTMEQTLIFSYQIEPSSSNPNEPVQFTCPCKASLSVFLSNLNYIPTTN